MRILVNGLLSFESGKTTFTLFLLRELKNSGLNVMPLKPVAGHNAWYSYNTLIRSQELGILVGNDALKYYDETHIDIRKINPFAVLFAPADLEYLQYNIDYYNLLMNSGFPVLVRISCEKDEYYGVNYHGIVPKSLSRALDQLFGQFSPRIISLNEIREMIDSSWKIADLCMAKTFNSDEVLLIESYNDAASPTSLSIYVDVVFAVAPGKAFAIKGEEFRKVISFLLRPPWLIRTSELIKYAKIEKSFDLELITSKNEKILDYLLSEL